MTYQCIPLSNKDYKATLKRVLDHPAKSRKYAHFSDKYALLTQAIKVLETLAPNKHLPMLLEPMQKDQKSCQEGMAKLLDSEYRAMQKEAKGEAVKKRKMIVDEQSFFSIIPICSF